MAPHIEIRCQAVVGDRSSETAFGTHWKKVPGTEHRTGDTKSKKAKKAHELLKNNSECREVKDKKGDVCHTYIRHESVLLFSPKEKG